MRRAPRQRRRSTFKRAFYSITAVVVVLVVGTIGFHQLEGFSYVDGFYFESMMAAGQGPPFPLNTDAGKIFASIMGFASVITVIASLALNILPTLGQLWREGMEVVEKEAKTLERDLGAKEGSADT